MELIDSHGTAGRRRIAELETDIARLRREIYAQHFEEGLPSKCAEGTASGIPLLHRGCVALVLPPTTHTSGPART